MKRIFGMLAALTVVSPVSPAFGAAVIIDGTHGKTVYIGNFSPIIDFTAELLEGSPTTFTATISGMTWGDPRWCAGFPPEDLPPDCEAPIDPISSWGMFTAEAEWPVFEELTVPFFGTAVNGYLTFDPTDGGRVRIEVDGRALPEPASWAMMLGGFGAIGGAMRARRKTGVTFG